MTVLAAARAVEVGLTGFRVTREDVLDLQFIAATKGVVDGSVQEMRDVEQFFGLQGSGLTTALKGMPLLEERPDLAAIAIAQHEHRPDQVGPLLVRGKVRITPARPVP